jgi:hypothetical protein
MASTSVHFPKGLLEDLERAAVEAGTSRNALIIESCRALLRRRRRDWPEGFFERGLSGDDHDLQSRAEDFTARIKAARRSRAEGPF